MKYYVASDLHGHYTEFIRALREKGWFEETEPHKLILCGDYLDRGEESEEIVAFLADLLKKEEVILIKGNHEDYLQLMLDEMTRYDNMLDVNEVHFQNQTVDTVARYAMKKGLDINECPRKCAEVFQESTFMTEVMPAMKDYFETKNYVFTHGWIPYQEKGFRWVYDEHWREADEETWQDARWTYGIVAAVDHKVLVPHKTVVCGHYATVYGHIKEGDPNWRNNRDPFYAEGIIDLDGTVYCSPHQMNIIVLEDEDL